MTVIRVTQTINSKDNLVLLGDAKSDFSSYGLTKPEADFVKQQIKADEHLITINQYQRRIIIYTGDEKKSDDNKPVEKDENLILESLRKAGNKASGILNKAKAEQVTLVDINKNAPQILAFAEGMALGNYQFLRHKKDVEKVAHTLEVINIHAKNVNATQAEHLQIIIESTNRARDLVNEPVNYLDATQLANEFVKMGKEAGFKVEVLNKAKIESLKMGGLLAVNRGSMDPPTFTIMEYKPQNAVNKKPYLLVGKGVVYDTGGVSIKPTSGMDTMKCDMAGGAAVGCTLYAIAKAKLPVYVVGLVPATDNRPGMNAYVPGDILTMHNGMTVEMLNADAEGRLILADALSYGKKYNPELAVDLATLTGAAAAAIGKYGIVAMGTAGKEVCEQLKQSGDAVNERLVQFPMWEEYGELLNTDIADIKNIGGPVAGAITAGKFLEKFTSYPWIHLDIAGPAFIDSNYDYKPKGATGVGVRLLFDFLSKVR